MSNEITKKWTGYFVHLLTYKKRYMLNIFI